MMSSGLLLPPKEILIAGLQLPFHFNIIVLFFPIIFITKLMNLRVKETFLHTHYKIIIEKDESFSITMLEKPTIYIYIFSSFINDNIYRDSKLFKSCFITIWF